MSTDDVHPLGYQRVDASPDPGVLLAGMIANAGWSATIDLRAWERDHLQLTTGERILDVGCGLGDAAARSRTTWDQPVRSSASTPAQPCSTQPD